jgi:hypothetical protein
MQRLFHYLGTLAFCFSRGKTGEIYRPPPPLRYLGSGIEYDFVKGCLINSFGVEVTLEFINILGTETFKDFQEFYRAKTEQNG